MSIIAPHYDPNRTTLSDVIPLRAPYSVQIEPSQYCNLSCNYCIQSLGQQFVKKQLMTMTTFAKIAKQIGEFGEKLKVVNFSGWGSPLINPLLPDMVRLLKSSDLAENVAIITNGVALHKGLSDALIGSNLDHLRFSIQGMSSKKYLEVSGTRVNFLSFINNIRYFYKIKGTCKVSVKIADIALEPGDDKVFYDTFGPITDQMYVESIRPMFAQNKQDGKMVSKYGVEHPPIKVCPLPFFMMSVTAAGDILPCCSYYDPTGFGNIKNISLREVWEGEKMRKFRLMLLEGNRNGQVDYPACKGCLMPDATITPGDELDERADEIRRRL